VGTILSLQASGPLTGHWDRMRLDQVVTNLLTNAIKYGRGKPVEIQVDRQGPAARLWVQDHGIGIAPEDHERIFSQFERAVSEDHYGGFGVGLWIARQIVNAFQGTITVQSQPGEGACFTVTLGGLS
jgi:signal transduction histidine kinase